MSRMKKMLHNLQTELKKRQEKSQKRPEELSQSSECLDVSSIEKASFFQGEHYSSHGNPLHSTALEDEITPVPDISKSTAGGKKTNGKGRNVKAQTETAKTPARGENVSAKKRQKGDVEVQRKSFKSKENLSPARATKQKPPKRHLQTVTEVREEDRRKSRVPRRDSADDGQQQSALSSEELTDEDQSFHPSNGKRKSSSLRRQRKSGDQQRGQKQKRKSSSGSSGNEHLSKKRKRGPLRSRTNLEVVLEAFQEFVLEYKETLNSEAVKHTIDAFSRLFEEELTEIITATKEFSSAKRKTAKINNTLNQKMTRLLEAKNELIRSEAKLRKLQKEHDEMDARLKAVQQASSFLTNLKQLNMAYLQHRHAHPDQPQTYDVSCLPAMLLEARSTTGTEAQLKMINDKLQQVLEQTARE